MFDTREKKERALGVKLFLKAERCSGQKCATIRRPYRPGMHGKSRRRRNLSEMGQQLMEKQKVRFSYGIRESQMRKVFDRAVKSPGVTGEMIVAFLEKRLDNIVYRFGFAPSRSVARQLVGHGHFLVNGHKVTTPSYRLKIGDVISIRPQSKDHPAFKELDITFKKYEAPSWLKMNIVKKEGEMVGEPKGIEMPFNINMVVDYYSK